MIRRGFSAVAVRTGQRVERWLVKSEGQSSDRPDSTASRRGCSRADLEGFLLALRQLRGHGPLRTERIRSIQERENLARSNEEPNRRRSEEDGGTPYHSLPGHLH